MTKESKIQLVIGDKNLSSWSLRPWLVLKYSQLPFEERKILLDRSETQEQINSLSPSGRLPCLIHGDLRVWDSLAICEYVAELSPGKNLWPNSPSERARARSYCAEMHSGFGSLREQLSMDIRLRMEIRHLTAGTIKDIQRIHHLWKDALLRSGGPFLFGEFSIADAFYAPVVFRFQSYGIKSQDEKIQDYLKSVLAFSPVREWENEATLEIPSQQMY